MIRRTVVTFVATTGLLLSLSALGATAHAGPAPVIGTGDRTCVLTKHANCRHVVHKWRVEHHGNLTGIKLTRAKIHGADLRGAILDGANLRGAVLRHAHLHEASFVNAKMGPAPRRSGSKVAPRDQPPVCTYGCEGIDLGFTISNGANFTGADLTNAMLNGSQNYTSNFTKAILVGAELDGADFQAANLTNANLTRVSGEGLTLMQANLTNANLTSADLEHARLNGADLTGANLTGADLWSADLTGAILTGVTWSQTTCPDGTVTNTGC